MLARTVLALAPFLLAASPLAAQDRPLGPVDGQDLAPTEIDRVLPGAAAPDFTLAAYGGGEVTLSDFRGERNVVLVFYRGHWCPYCIRQLSELRTLLDEDLAKDTELLVVSVDGDAETRQAVGRIARDGGAEPDFTFLSDPESAVIGRYGILNPSGGRRGIPHPATYVIDRDGTVRWRDVQTDYTVRPTNRQIRDALAEIREG
ncbi:MAG: peroxiredoxin family protein [Gemmatimonadota bacterium]|nr:peroxiredoxin family protein [Gemmatimonadota bacterium]